MKCDYNLLFIAALLLLGIGQVLDGMMTPPARFVHGFLVGLSIAFSVAGLVLYARTPKKS